MDLSGFTRAATYCVASLLFSWTCIGAGIERKSFSTSDWIQRADLYFLQDNPEPQGWLILCPGRNGNGENLVKDPKWQDFAKAHQLWICGISFMSNRKDDLLGRYTLVSQGSGEIILGECDDRATRSLPIFIVGFSAGARFTTNFVAWKPQRVAAWSAQAVGHWPDPVKDGRSQPPGIVASGEYDAGSWFPSLQYFQAARKEGHPLVWLSLRGLGHQKSPGLDDYTRQLFEWKLSGMPAEAVWRDIDSKKVLNVDEVNENPIFATWFPSQKLALMWDSLHYP